MKHIKFTKYLSLVCIAVFVFVGCEIQEDFKYQPGNVGGKLDVNAWGYIQQSDSLSLLRQAITYANVQSLFESADSKTFILPNNTAFRTYLKENNYSTVENIPSRYCAICYVTIRSRSGSSLPIRPWQQAIAPLHMIPKTGR